MLQRLQAGGVAPLQIVKQQDQRTAPARQKFLTSASTIWLGSGHGHQWKMYLPRSEVYSPAATPAGHPADGQLFISFGARERRILPLRHLFRRQPEQV